MTTIIYNCKKCRIGKRVEYPIVNGRGFGTRIDLNGIEQPAGVWINSCGGDRPTVYGGDIEMGVCSGCGRAMDYNELKGVLHPEHKCDARCAMARGANCECSCGGANHGKGWT